MAQGMAAIGFIGNKLADGDIVWDWRKLLRPCGRCEDHLDAREDVLVAGGNGGIAPVIDQDREVRENKNREEQWKKDNKDKKEGEEREREEGEKWRGGEETRSRLNVRDAGKRRKATELEYPGEQDLLLLLLLRGAS